MVGMSACCIVGRLAEIKVVQVSYIINPYQALMLLKESEQHGGHPCTKHINLSNDQLMARLYQGDGARNGGIVYLSTFNSERDASKAASQAFKNLPAGVTGVINRKNMPEIRIDETINVRFAFGSGVRTLPANHVKLILFANEEQKKHGLFYIKTFYPCPPNSLRETSLEGNVDG
ncbi:hypothetical protein JQ543_20470 [Bradyrhizobium diazoefficiens]|nr:hypothetical protein [Bradyrhizobium diazoefficiens]